MTPIASSASGHHKTEIQPPALPEAGSFILVFRVYRGVILLPVKKLE